MPATPITALAQVNPEWILATLEYSEGGSKATRVATLQHTNGDFALPPAPEPYGLNATAEGDSFLYSLEAPLYNSETTLSQAGHPVYQVPASYTKVARWYLTYQPESETSPHLTLSKPNIQGWTYIADYTMHHLTPGVSTFNYYLHGRITYRNTLEFAFFDHPVRANTTNSELEVAEVLNSMTLQRLNKSASSSALRIATKEESEAKMLDASGKLIMALEPKCLGVMMNTGNVWVKQKGFSTGSYGNFYYFYGYLLHYYGHIWIYWSTIQNETLYIVGQPLYAGQEQGSVVEWQNFSEDSNVGINKLTAAGIPPTYYDLSHFYTSAGGSDTIQKRTVTRSEMDGFRKAFDSVFSKNPYTAGYGNVTYHPVWASGRADLSTAMKDMVANTSLSLNLDLSQQDVNLTGGDSLYIAGENTFRGGVYRPYAADLVSPQALTAITFLMPDGDAYKEYGHLPGVVNNFVESATACQTLRYAGRIHSIPDIQYSNSGFIPTVTLSCCTDDTGTIWQTSGEEIPDEDLEGNWQASGICCLQTMNVVQRGKSYDLWLSSAGSALTFPVGPSDPLLQGFSDVILPDATTGSYDPYGPYYQAEAIPRSSFPFVDPTIDEVEPDKPIGPGPIDPDVPPVPPPDPWDPDPDPIPDPDPGPGPDPDPGPGPDPNPDPSDPDPPVPQGWTRVDIPQEGYYYQGGNGVTVRLTKVYGQRPFYDFAIQMLNQSGSMTAQYGVNLNGSMSGGGSYRYTSGTYYCSYSVAAVGSSFVMHTTGNADNATAENNTASMTIAHQAAVTYSGVESDYVAVTSDDSLGNYNLFSVSTGAIYTRKLVRQDNVNKILYYQVIRTKTVSVNRNALQRALAQHIKSNLPSLNVSPTSFTGSGVHGTPSLSISYSLKLQSPTTSAPVRPSLAAGTMTIAGHTGVVATVSDDGSGYEYGTDGNNLQTATPTISGNITATIDSKTINI